MGSGAFTLKTAGPVGLSLAYRAGVARRVSVNLNAGLARNLHIHPL